MKIQLTIKIVEQLMYLRIIIQIIKKMKTIIKIATITQVFIITMTSICHIVLSIITQ